jgi:hypothetical protein
MTEQPADTTAITAASVTPGLGYPNERVETSPNPIGWHGLDQTDIRIVSRETSESN